MPETSKPREMYAIKLKITSYGLKQSGRMWYNRLSEYLLTLLYHTHPDCFSPYNDLLNLIAYIYFYFDVSGLLNPSGIFMYISLSSDPYK